LLLLSLDLKTSFESQRTSSMVPWQDIVVAIDTRWFHDPDEKAKRRKSKYHKTTEPPDPPNHIGLHGNVQAGLMRGGAVVVHSRTWKRKDYSLRQWMVKWPVRHLIEAARRAWPVNGGRVIIVFYCKSGRHRSVACAEAFSRVLNKVAWVQQENVEHLSSMSWGFGTCGGCPQCRRWSADHGSVDDHLAGLEHHLHKPQ
jgi:hypothetical protein